MAFVLLGARVCRPTRDHGRRPGPLAQAESRIDKLVGDYARAESDARRQALEHERAIAAKEQFLTATLEANAREAQRAQSAIAADRDRAALLSTACATSSPPSSNAIALTARQAQILPLPDSSRQPATPSVCLPTCSAALTSERASWQIPLTALTPQDLACERDYDAARAALMEQGWGRGGRNRCRVFYLLGQNSAKPARPAKPHGFVGYIFV